MPDEPHHRSEEAIKRHQTHIAPRSRRVRGRQQAEEATPAAQFRIGSGQQGTPEFLVWVGAGHVTSPLASDEFTLIARSGPRIRLDRIAVALDDDGAHGRSGAWRPPSP